MRQRVGFGGQDVTTDTSSSWTTLLIVPTSTSKIMPNSSSGGIFYRIGFWVNGYGETGVQTGLVMVRKNSGTIYITEGLASFARSQTGGIYPPTAPLIEWTVSVSNIILQVKCAQKDVSGYAGYNLNDFVTYGGSTYVCILAHATPQTPPNATYWLAITYAGVYTENHAYSTNDYVFWDGSGNYWYATASIPSGNGNDPGSNSDWTAMNERGPWDAGTGGLADLSTSFFVEHWWVRRKADA